MNDVGHPLSAAGSGDDDEWISAAETIRLIREHTLSPSSNEAIATRAHVGMLRARADLLLIQDRRVENAHVPAEFWWATGGAALKQNWELGDFSTWIHHKHHLQAFGVAFHAGDLRRMAPDAFAPKPLRNTEKNPVGRRISPLWPNWVAELALHVHESGIPAGEGYQGAEELITAVADRLAERGLECPGRSTVQEAVRAVLNRLRSAEN